MTQHWGYLNCITYQQASNNNTTNTRLLFVTHNQIITDRYAHITCTSFSAATRKKNFEYVHELTSVRSQDTYQTSKNTLSLKIYAL